MLKTQDITPGDNPVYDAELDNKKNVSDTEREIQNPLYRRKRVQHQYETTTLPSDQERKFNNPIYEDLQKAEQIIKDLANSFDDAIYGKSLQMTAEPGTNIPQITTTDNNLPQTEIELDFVNPMQGNENTGVQDPPQELIPSVTNPLFMQHYDTRSSTKSTASGSSNRESDTASSLMKSFIYDDDFMQQPTNIGDTTGSEPSTETIYIGKRPGSAKQASPRRQDYEEVV